MSPSSCIIADVTLQSIVLVECILYMILLVPGDPTYLKMREWFISCCYDGAQAFADRAANPQDYKQGSIKDWFGKIWWVFVKYRNIYLIILIAIDKIFINWARHKVTDEPNEFVAETIWLYPIIALAIIRFFSWTIPIFVISSLSAQLTMAMHITTQFVHFSVGIVVGALFAYIIGKFIESELCESIMVYLTVSILSSFLMYQLHDYSIAKGAPNCIIICDIHVTGDMVTRNAIDPLMTIVYIIITTIVLLLNVTISGSLTICNYRTCVCQQCWCGCLDRCAMVPRKGNRKEDIAEMERLSLQRPRDDIY